MVTIVVNCSMSCLLYYRNSGFESSGGGGGYGGGWGVSSIMYVEIRVRDHPSPLPRTIISWGGGEGGGVIQCGLKSRD
jgi:hypothetical protein